MKNLKKLALLLLITAMLIPSLAACGKGDGTIGKKAKDFDKIYESSFTMPFDLGYTSATEFKLPDTATSIVGGYGFLQYRDTEAKEYYFYNVETDSTVLKVATDKIEKDSDITLYDGYIKIIETNADSKAKTTSVYSAAGALLVSAEGEIAISVTENGFAFKETFYYVEDGALKKEYSIPPFTQINDTYTFTDNYVIRENDQTVVYYNDQFEAVAIYEVPGNCEDYSLFLLDNDQLFVQYAVACDTNENKYSFIAEGSKYILHSLLFDPKKEKENDLELDVYVASVINRQTEYGDGELDFEDIFTDEAENVLLYYAIVDGVIDLETPHFVLMSNKGKVGATLDGYVENQKGLVAPLNNGYFYVPTKDGYAILDGKGELVRNIPNVGRATEYGYYSNGKIYNKNFELVIDLGNNSYSILNSSSDAAVFYSKQVDGKTHYYRYDKNGEAEITAPEGREFYDNSPVNVYTGYYVVRHALPNSGSQYNTLQCNVYSMNGELLFTSDYSYDYTSFKTLASSDDAILVSYIDADTNETVYKRLAK